MNKIGIQSGYIFNDDNFMQGLDIIKNAGFDCIDFNIDTKISPRRVRDGEAEDLFFTKSDEELKEFYTPLKEYMNKTGITMSQMHAPFPVYFKGYPEASETVLRSCEKCIMLCAFFDCPYLVVHPVKGDDPVDEKEQNMYIYKRLAPTAKKYGVGICLENMFTSIGGHITEAVCSDLYQTIEYIDELNAFAGEKIFSFCYDLGHATLLGKDIRRSVNLLGDRLTVLHIHDNNGMNDTHVQPYSQKRNADFLTDWEGFINGLADIDFKGVLSFETFNAVRNLPQELIPAMVNYIGAVGKYFASRLEK